MLKTLFYLLPLLFLGVFYFYPLTAILKESLVTSGQLNISQIGELFSRPFIWHVLWFTLWQAAVSTLITLTLGLPLAYVFAHFNFPAKRLLRALITVPFVMPTVVTAAAFSALAGPNGMLNRWLETLFLLEEPPITLMQSIWGILLAHVFYNTSVIVRTVGGFWSRLSPHVNEAAAVLGADVRRRWLHITLPLLAPSILASSLLVFLFCFTSFGVVLIIGGLRYSTIEVEIYRQTVALFNLPLAAVLSLLQIVVTFGIMSLYTRMQSKLSVSLSQHRSIVSTSLEQKNWPLVLVTAVAVLTLLAPLIALAWRSVSLGEEWITLRYYAELTINRAQSAFFVAPVIAIWNSVLYALITTVCSLLLGISGAYLLVDNDRLQRHLGSLLANVEGASSRSRRRRKARIVEDRLRIAGRLSFLLDPLLLLPLGTSAVTLGFGYILSMGSWRTSLWLIPMAHTLIAAPFVVRTFLPALRSLDPRIQEAAAILGASPARVWWEIDVPVLFRAVLVGAMFAFSISLGEFGATLLVSRPDRPTMPMVIFQALGQPGLLNYGQALAMSTILMLVSAISIMVIERLRVQDLGEF